MTQQSTVYLNLFWHQHQPWYVSPGEKTAIMPWVRLHGIKDYYDMAELCQRFEGWKQTINLVPSLLEQIQLFIDNKITDHAWDVSLKPANELTYDDKIYILQRFFDAHYPRLIHPFTRYDELYKKRGSSAEKACHHFSTEDFRDLQVWFNLAWFDPIWREDPQYPLKTLVDKQRGFSEDEKQQVLNFQKEVLRKIIPIHRDMQQKGSLELTCTPYFHPILPLLCDTSIAKVSNPHDPVIEPPFAHPEDAEWHIKEGLDFFEKVFGYRPEGMWPSEGSVSDAACALMAKMGVRYFATDEQILFRSKATHGLDLQDRSNLFRLHRLETEQGELDCIFRDHGLSDGIGFQYANMSATQAAKTFINHLKNIGKGWQDSQPPLVNVILDGENCWEFYPNDGHDFLKYTIEGILKDDQIIPITVPEYRELFPPQPTLKSIFPGSWISHNFRIWIGHHEDNTAWNHLRDARNALQQEGSRLDPAIKDECWRLLHISEGSDWFWWYGDENQSTMDFLFDQLFRTHLIKLYELLELPVPENLYRAIKQPKAVDKSGGILFQNPLDDQVAQGYYKWIGAKHFSSEETGGAMHQANGDQYDLYYGRENSRLCFAIHSSIWNKENQPSPVTLKITKPLMKDIPLTENQEGCHIETTDDGIDAWVDLEQAGIKPDQEIWFFLLVENGDSQTISIPSGSELHVQGYTPSNAGLYWFI